MVSEVRRIQYALEDLELTIPRVVRELEEMYKASCAVYARSVHNQAFRMQANEAIENLKHAYTGMITAYVTNIDRHQERLEWVRKINPIAEIT